jgi:hypothetical protein
MNYLAIDNRPIQVKRDLLEIDIDKLQFEYKKSLRETLELETKLNAKRKEYEEFVAFVNSLKANNLIENEQD